MSANQDPSLLNQQPSHSRGNSSTLGKSRQSANRLPVNSNSYISLRTKDQLDKFMPLIASASNYAVNALRASSGASALTGNNKFRA